FGTTAADQSPCTASATIINSDDNDELFRATQQPPLDPSIFTSAPPSTASGKRKAIKDDDSTLTPVCPSCSTKSGGSGKAPCLMMLLAIQQMGSDMHSLSSTFEHVLTNTYEANTLSSADSTPMCRQKAVLQLQKEGLEAHQILNILHKFQSDIAIVDIYLAIKDPAVKELFLNYHSK
ncbi:hypothetical protein AZE42_10823, partial [Rhizopogon vesiculosus]